MKNVYTSWDINLLADNMMARIMESWKSPFCSPALVFTDPKTEQWFKLHWLKNPVAGNSILMNLKTLRIQQFLFDLINPQDTQGAGRESEKLSVELLRDLIITKLTGKYSREIDDYISKDANHLYDFAQTLASLFLDYEDTRPDSLDTLLSSSSWQKKLYDDVIGEKGVEIDGKKYLTLYQLVKASKEKNGGSLSFNWKKDRPVFIFGFTGLGQIYRNILDDFSKEYPLEVFLQLDEIKEKPANQLLKDWGKFGREQFGLWSKNGSCKILDALPADDSRLHRIQKSIFLDENFPAGPYDEADTSITLTGAPTRLREVEALHSRVCGLLSKNEGTQLGDILVLAPHIQDYKTAIEQVFDQNDQYAADSDFPYIPYIIADYSGERSLTAEALTVLFGILKKGYLSRSDFFALLHNYLVQTVRGLSDSEISDWADWTSKLNIYRDRENHEEWKKARSRLLLARLTSDLVNNELLPFETMTTADNESLYNFIQVIDELEEWASYASKEKYDISDIDKIEELLKKWLLIGDDIPSDLYNESLVFQNVVEEIERQRLTARPDVFADCFANALFDRSHAVTLHSSNILTQGITFANFESNRILSAKYIFFIGLDSKTFPGVDSENVLDLRGGKDQRQAGDESIPDRNKNAFLCQLMAAGQGLFFSYVNKNLQKDEDLFKSSVLNTLFQTLYNCPSSEYEKQIKIDEERPWQELYTPREFRNKKNFIALQENSGKEESPAAGQTASSGQQEQNTNLPDRITISQMKKFLQEPFVSMVNQKLTNNYDDEEKEDLEFEPLVLGKKVSSDLRKAYIQAKLQSQTPLNEKDLAFELGINNALPDSFFGERAIKTVFENAEALFQEIKTNGPDTTSFVFNENKMQQIKAIEGITTKDWFISGELAWYNKDYIETQKINTLELSNSKSILNGYITTLLLLAGLPEDDKREFEVSLYYGALDSNNHNKPIVKSERHYKATGSLARTVLNEIYEAMFISQFHRCAPETLVYKDLVEPSDKSPVTFKSFMNDLTSDFGQGAWQYFSKKKLFEPESDLGYDDGNFDDEWKAVKNKMAELILYISQNKKPDAEVGE